MTTVRRGKEWERQMLEVNGSGVHYGSEEGWPQSSREDPGVSGDLSLDHVIEVGKGKVLNQRRLSHSVV